MWHRDGDGALRKGIPGTHGKVPLQQKRLCLFAQPWLAVLPGVRYVPASQMVVSIDPYTVRQLSCCQLRHSLEPWLSPTVRGVRVMLQCCSSALAGHQVTTGTSAYQLSGLRQTD